MGQAFSESFPPKATWLSKDMPDMTGKVAIVTGGNSGIGKVTIKYLLLKNCVVYLLCCSASKAEAAIAEAAIADLKAATGKVPVFIQCDLADLHSIRASATEFLAKAQRLDVLFNNAGSMTTPMDWLTKQGYDMQFGTNVLGTGYLTMLLLPLIQATAKSYGGARIVTLSSNAQDGAPKGGIDFSTLKDGPERGMKLTHWTAYMQSKWADACLSKELSRRYGKDGVVCTALNPGIIRTDLARNLNFIAWFSNTIGHDADPLGAVTQLYAGTAPEAASLNGQYLIPWARVGKARADTEDPVTGKALWEWIEEQGKTV
ncbi:NAD(P)-binding protein [Calocera cornea HHB12733]|uniref:NAD(P)-binding protein n=1 Tax=Calocera cornea HHB12733 TaxID=1353952 RepID=A0A165EE80_9BASI|nr:NAD(P)-binding protein [Calocera cornea HHB12733]